MLGWDMAGAVGSGLFYVLLSAFRNDGFTEFLVAAIIFGAVVFCPVDFCPCGATINRRDYGH
jgi:hypothetical protein